MLKTIKIFLLLIIALLFASCSYRPVLYPNAHFKEVGETQADKDVDEALNAADNAKNLGHNYGKEAMDTGVTTAAGAGVGTAVGAVSGSGTGVGAISGAISGAAVGAVRWIFMVQEPSQIYKNYVDAYLAEKGYKVIGWN